MTKYKALDINQNYQKIIQLKLQKKLLIDACFLITQYIECFLRDWLLITGKKEPKGILNKKLSEIKFLKLDHLIQIHLFLDNIDTKLYVSINRIKKLRHSYAHNLLNKNLNNPSEFNKDKKKIEDAILTCDKIYEKYYKKLNEETKIIVSPGDFDLNKGIKQGINKNGDLIG